MADYLDELNEQQRAAVEYIKSSLIIARAGSGKTKVLTCKIAYLLDHGYEPWSILALTFTNKAAREMKERIAKEVGADKAKDLWMGTFHSVFLRILRSEAQTLGMNSDFTIYDSSDSISLIRTIIRELKLSEITYKPNFIFSRISAAKNNIITPDLYSLNQGLCEADAEVKIPMLAKIYELYVERCKIGNAMDFDDLLLNTYFLFENHSDICDKYADRFRFILVDEYQDTNKVQSKILKQLSKKHKCICAVGDDAQSIYSFRGADIDNILNFKEEFSAEKTFLLLNYRSTKTIVKAAYSLICKNKERIQGSPFDISGITEKEKDKFCFREEVGDKIEVQSAYSDVEEAEIVANRVAMMHIRDNSAYSDFAILYRTNAQSRVFEEAFRKRSIPYRIYGGLSFYQRKEIKDIIAYFRLAVNPDDEEALKRVINYPARGIGNTTLGKIIAAASENNVSLWKVLNEPLAYNLNVNKGTHAKLQGFRDLVAGFIEQVSQKDASELGRDIVRQSGILGDIYQDRSPENLSRQENIDEMMNGMRDFCETRREEGNEHVLLTDYLSEVSLLSDQDEEKDDSIPKVTLMTVHSAKGLEFPNVFVVGMEDGLFPSTLSGESPRQLEEERRLFYVAITRAEERCFLSYAKSRYRYGKMEFSVPSRFLKDIDMRYLNVAQADGMTQRVDEGMRRFRSGTDERSSYHRVENDGSSIFDGGAMPEEPRHFVKPLSARNLKRVDLSSVQDSPDRGSQSENEWGIAAGKKVVHARFGKGEVIRVEGAGDNCKATIRFANAGVKQLLLKFARFEKIE